MTPKIKKNIKRKKYKPTGLPWFDDGFCVVRGEKALWVAVITQAMMDALSKSKSPETQYHKDEAIRWLTDNGKDFHHVCMLAGFDPSYIRKKAKKAIVSPSAWRAAPGKGKRYHERKSKREAAKQQVTKEPQPVSKPQPSHCNVIQGPWQ